MLASSRRVFAAAVLSLAALATGQSAALPSHWGFARFNSGIHQNPTPVEGVVFRDFVTPEPGAPWLRLYFNRIWLDKGSYLRIVSVKDGSVQTLHQHHVEQWQHSSAYFNGDTVMVELIAGPNTLKNYVEIQKVMVGETGAGMEDTICGNTDDRVPSSHPAVARIDPIGCTGWLIDVPASGTDRLHLSAGHCFAAGVLEFDVPASAANCALVHPPASKQFAIDTASSIQVNGGAGNDYWVFRCFPNPTTGLTTFQTQGQAFPLAGALPGLGTTLRNYGFGVDGTPTNNATGNSCSCTSGNGARNQVQQTHTGPLNGVAGNRLDYGFDTCGGNSGSVVLNNSGQAIGIHTHGGCTASGGSNSGTSITHPNLQAAIQALSGGGGGTVANDECSGATAVVDGVNGLYSNSGATNSSTFPCGGGGRDIWFRYVSTCSGVVTFDTCSANRTVDTVIEVFSGSCGSLVSLGCNDDSCGLGSRLQPTLVAGQTYFVRVGGFNGAQGSFDLTVTTCGTADECTGAIPLQLGPNGPFSNAAATNSAPAFPCGFNTGKDVWFTYQAPPATVVTFTTCNASTGFDTVIQAFSGGCGGLLSLGCNDDWTGCATSSLRSRLQVTTTAATTLWVRVGGYNGVSGTFQLDVDQAPANDDCAAAVAVQNGLNGPFSTLNATTSAPWPCAAGGRDVWFTYQAACSGTLLVDTCSAARTYDTALEIFSGSCGALVSLGCNDDACQLGSSLAVPVSQGQTYWIRLGGFLGLSGQAELNVTCSVAGDECSGALPLSQGVNGPYTNTGATTSQPWSCAFGGTDIWFAYTAPATVPLTFWTCTPTRTFDTIMEVFDGTCAALNSVGCNDDFCGLGSRVTIQAVQGTTYFVRIGGFNNQIGQFDIEVQPGTGSGSIVRIPHGCGPLQIQSSGQPRIGGTVSTQLGGGTGVPFVGLGIQPGATPFCGCTLGHEWLVVLFGNSHVLNTPLTPSLIGLQVGVQGADFFGVGGCPAPQIGFSDTMVITIG